MKTRIGDAALVVMKEQNIIRLAWGDAHALDEIRNRAGCEAKRRVPTDGWQHVLNALGRDERFEKRYFRGHTGARGGGIQKRRLRMFVIKEAHHDD